MIFKHCHVWSYFPERNYTLINSPLKIPAIWFAVKHRKWSGSHRNSETDLICHTKNISEKTVLNLVLVLIEKCCKCGHMLEIINMLIRILGRKPNCYLLNENIFISDVKFELLHLMSAHVQSSRIKHDLFALRSSVIIILMTLEISEIRIL